MFPRIETIDDVLPHIQGVEQIRVLDQPGGRRVICYIFQDSKTFANPYARECRGITFDREGRIESRPLHKFFNVGEKAHLTKDAIIARADEIVAIYDKLDGSLISTSWSMENGFAWRSKKAYDSEIVRIFEQHVPPNVQEFAQRLAKQGYTAGFEFVSPQNQVVVRYDEPAVRLLHVRDDRTGEYVLLDPEHPVHSMIHAHGVKCVPNFHPELTVEQAFSVVETMDGAEGFVFQFDNGEMVKLKCPWYTRFHRAVSYLRERDIAVLALHEELDDVKGKLAELGHDLAQVNEIESRLMNRLLQIEREVAHLTTVGRSIRDAHESAHEGKKAFVASHSKLELFGLAVKRLEGRDDQLKQWYERSKLKSEFGLRSLLTPAQLEALNG